MSQKVVVVTGGTKGIGRGLVREFVERGCLVVYCGRSETTIPGADGVVADVTRRDEIQKVWDFAAEKHGGVDIWINTAGMSLPRRKLWELDPAGIDAAVDLNLRAVLHGGAVVLAGMLAQGTEERARVQRILNVLADRVETVTPWLADRILAGGRNASRVAWLTRRKAMWRFMTAFRRRDVMPSPPG